jgi:DNA-directed RNA polymerase subunit RPC12/RpoP
MDIDKLKEGNKLKTTESGVLYICIQCGNDIYIKEDSNKESIKCTYCNYRILSKARNPSKPLCYKAR